MDTSSFSKLVDRTLDAYEESLSQADLDLDFERGDGKLTLIFKDASRVILSRQGVVSELWLAEPHGGWHFRFEKGQFICNKRQLALEEALSQLVFEKTGQKLDFSHA